jgi:hypothetical protein
MRSVSLRCRGGVVSSSRLPPIAGAPLNCGAESGILLLAAFMAGCGVVFGSFAREFA